MNCCGSQKVFRHKYATVWLPRRSPYNLFMSYKKSRKVNKQWWCVNCIFEFISMQSLHPPTHTNMNTDTYSCGGGTWEVFVSRVNQKLYLYSPCAWIQGATHKHKITYCSTHHKTHSLKTQDKTKPCKITQHFTNQPTTVTYHYSHTASHYSQPETKPYTLTPSDCITASETGGPKGAWQI